VFEQGKEGKIVIKFHMSYDVTEVLENGISYTNRSGIEHKEEYFTLEEANAVKEEIIKSVKKVFNVKNAEKAYGGSDENRREEEKVAER
jgi:PhoPQ-activated pathogenicity-related protein